MKIRLFQFKFFMLLSIALFISCNQISDSYSDSDDLINSTIDGQVQYSEETTFDITNNSIEGDWVRVGSSGTGKDIAVKDIPYIIGENNKIYFFDSVANSWSQEPGGGEGKMISYQLNNGNSASPRLYIRGNNDSIYYKTRGSSSGWNKLSDFSTRSLSTYEYSDSTPVLSLSFVGYKYSDPYHGGTQLSQDYSTPYSPGAILLIDEMTGSYSDGLYATAKRWEEVPCCRDLGDGVFKYNFGDSQWEYIGGEGIDIAMGGPQNDIWMVGKNNKIYKRVNNDWIQTVSGTAKRISVASNGTPYIIGENNKIYKLVQ